MKNGGKRLRGVIFLKEGMRCVLVVTTISRKFEGLLNYLIMKKTPGLYSLPVFCFEHFLFLIFVIRTTFLNKNSFTFKYVDAIYYCCQKLYFWCSIIFCQFLIVIILSALPFDFGCQFCYSLPKTHYLLLI